MSARLLAAAIAAWLWASEALPKKQRTMYRPAAESNAYRGFAKDLW
jgi:hypothetical protein